MDEAIVNKAGIAPLQPALDKIAALKDKSQLPELVAGLQRIVRPANLNFIDAQYQGILFGIYNGPDFDDARVNIGTLDQSGMNMPSREFYLNDDEKSKEIREKYVKHVARMLELSGESKEQAGRTLGRCWRWRRPWRKRQWTSWCAAIRRTSTTR
jgi:predicted metalloendopeptidase